MSWYPAITYCLAHSLGRSDGASKMGRTTKVVPCEQCGRRYAYEMKRTGKGSANTLFGGGKPVAEQQAAENLRFKLTIGVDLVPCPACGWYQSDMIPKARKLHRRWMINLGAFLLVGLIPLMLIGIPLNYEQLQLEKSIPWPLYVAGLVLLGILGLSLLIGQVLLARGYDPNERDVEDRKRLGQSRSVPLPEQTEMEEEPSPEEGPGEHWNFWGSFESPREER